MKRPLKQPADLSVLSDCAAEVAEAFVTLDSDIALVIDENGVVERVAQSAATPMSAVAEGWVGRPWAEVVTGDTRRKIELMLTDLNVTGVARRREVNLPGEGGQIPVAFTALRLGRAGPVIAAGRDLRAISAIQQRFLDVQQEMERGYWRARQLESRYRLLFQVATDAVMTVEAHSMRVVEANHAATVLFDGNGGGSLAGRVVTELFDASSRVAVHGLLDGARSVGRPAEIHARLGGALRSAAVSATPFRARDGMRLLVRVRPQEPDAGTTTPSELNVALARLVDTTHEGVVVTDSGGHVLVANPAFVNMVRADGEAEVRGRAIGDWIGRIPEDVPALIAGVHGHGIARLVCTSLRRGGAAPDALDVDVSAALLTEGDQECFGFTVRVRPETRPEAVPGGRRARLMQSLADIEAELGGVGSPVLLERGRLLLEQYLAQSALERGGGDPARAASLLGLSAAEFERILSQT